MCLLESFNRGCSCETYCMSKKILLEIPFHTEVCACFFVPLMHTSIDRLNTYSMLLVAVSGIMCFD